MAHPEYMHIKLKDLPEEFVLMCNLVNKVTSDGFVDIKIQKELLERLLNQHSYRQSPLMPGLWQHELPHIIHTVCGQFWHQVRWP